MRRGPLWLRHVAGAPGDPPRVAYAVGRQAGSAVQRNRIRRRLREAVRDAERTGRLAPGAYLLGASPEVLTMPHAELSHAVAALLHSVGEPSR